MYSRRIARLAVLSYQAPPRLQLVEVRHSKSGRDGPQWEDARLNWRLLGGIFFEQVILELVAFRVLSLQCRKTIRC